MATLHTNPFERFEPVRDMPVEELCREWGITLERLDELLAPLFTPKPRARRHRPPHKLGQAEGDESGTKGERACEWWAKFRQAKINLSA